MVVEVQELPAAKTTVVLLLPLRAKWEEIGSAGEGSEPLFRTPEGERLPTADIRIGSRAVLPSLATAWQEPLEEVRVAEIPHLRIRREARALLTTRSKPLAQTLEAIILTKVFQTRMVVREFLLSAFSDPEEDWKELVFEIRVASLPAQALALWDCIGAAIDDWKTRMPDHMVELLSERFSVHVTWE